MNAYPTGDPRHTYYVTDDDGTLEISAWDVRTDVFRNEAEAIVKLTHLPTGLTSTATHERDPAVAKLEALALLAEALKARTKR